METQEENVSSFSIEDILSAWNLSQYLENFVLNEFTAEDIFTLSEDSNEIILKDLIPIGSHRLRFKMNCGALSTASNDVPESRDDAVVVPLTGTPDLQMNMNSSITCLQDINSNCLSPTGNDQQQVKKRKPLEEPSGSVPEKRLQTCDSVPEKRLQTCDSVPEKRLQTCDSVPNQELCDLLKQTGSGRIILALAKKSNVLKQEKDQNKLCEIIIEKKILCSSNYKIKSSEFPHIVASIKSLFPGENEDTYYIPYRNQNKVKCLAKGKLISKYYTLRKDMKAGGVIKEEDKNNNSDSDDEPSSVVEGADEKIKFLQENITPWDDVVQFWKETSRIRLSSIQRLQKEKPKKTKGSKNNDTENDGNDDSDCTVMSYIATYPALRTKEGYTLFEADFATLYPNYTLKVYSDFEGFVTQAITALKNIEKKAPALTNNIEILENGDLSQEAKYLVVLLSLCYLDTVVTVTRAKKQGKTLSWRPPQPEIQEGFISHVETPGRVDSFISTRYQKFASWGLPVQPFVVVCGPTVEDIDDCYIVISKTVKFNGISSVRRALDICFKIIHAVNAQYSCESHRLWMLIQKRLYGLDTKADNLKNDAQLPGVFKRFDC